MLTLKDYQKRTLAALEDYLTHARMLGPKDAFARYVAKNPTDVHPQVYRTRWNLDTVPDICLRLPTGGGKGVFKMVTEGVDSLSVEKQLAGIVGQ